MAPIDRDLEVGTACRVQGSGVWNVLPELGSCSHGRARRRQGSGERNAWPALFTPCYGLNCGPPHSYAEALTPSTPECDCVLWRQDLYKGNWVKIRPLGSPNPIWLVSLWKEIRTQTQEDHVRTQGEGAVCRWGTRVWRGTDPTNKCISAFCF